MGCGDDGPIWIESEGRFVFRAAKEGWGNKDDWKRDGARPVPKCVDVPEERKSETVVLKSLNRWIPRVHRQALRPNLS